MYIYNDSSQGGSGLQLDYTAANVTMLCVRASMHAYVRFTKMRFQSYAPTVNREFSAGISDLYECSIFFMPRFFILGLCL